MRVCWGMRSERGMVGFGGGKEGKAYPIRYKG